MKAFRLRLLVLACLAAPAYALTPTPEPPAAICPAAAALQAQVMEAAPKCVATTVGLVRKVKSDGREGISAGSGVVISADGLIMTAGHALEAPGNELTVRFPNGTLVKGVAVGLDHATDIGLARITDPAPAGGWTFSPVAPDESAKVGEWVLATGYPGAIVIDRNPPLRIGRVTAHSSDIINTNCAIEPGDSGGPLFDLQGRVIGITTSITTTTGSAVHEKEFTSSHVPISLFNSEMKDLLAGANKHPESAVGQPYRPDAADDSRSGLLQEAINKLASEKDPELMKMVADSQDNGGLREMTPELRDHLIAKAGLSANPSTEPSTSQPPAAGATTEPATASGPATRPAVAAAPPATQPALNGIPPEQRPAMAAQFKSSLQKRYPNATVTDATLNRILDRATFKNGRLSVMVMPQDLTDMGVSPSSAMDGGHGNRAAAAKFGKTSLQTLSLVAPSILAAGDCVVEIRDGAKPILLGTIVSEDGYIVTKASDLPQHPKAVLADGRALEARVIGKDAQTDLALLKVAAHGLTPAEFAGDAQLGEWVTALTDDPSEPAIGIVSDAARPIPSTLRAYIGGQQHVMLGVEFTGPDPVVAMISPGMPAEAAGMKVGDKIIEFDGKPVKTSDEIVAAVRSHKSGDTLDIRVHRGDKGDLELKPVLGKATATDSAALSKNFGDADSLAGGELSKRRTNLPMAIQTDAAVWACQVGGPLIDLQGKAVGITIARYDRVCTFALPADLVKKTIEKLKTNPTTQPLEEAQDGATAPGPGGEMAGANALEGKDAPDFKLAGLDDKHVALADLKGSVAIVDFWATWCSPCRASLPHLAEVYAKYKDAGLHVYAVDCREDKQTVQGFVDQTKLAVPVLLDTEGNVSEKYGANAIPETVVIGKDGKVRKVFVGFSPDAEEELIGAVKAAMAE